MFGWIKEHHPHVLSFGWGGISSALWIMSSVMALDPFSVYSYRLTREPLLKNRAQGKAAYETPKNDRKKGEKTEKEGETLPFWIQNSFS